MVDRLSAAGPKCSTKLFTTFSNFPVINYFEWCAQEQATQTITPFRGKGAAQQLAECAASSPWVWVWASAWVPNSCEWVHPASGAWEGATRLEAVKDCRWDLFCACLLQPLRAAKVTNHIRPNARCAHSYTRTLARVHVHGYSQAPPHPRFFVALGSARSVSSRLLAAMIFMMASALFLSSDCSPVSASRRSSCISRVLRIAESVRMFS